MQIIQQIKRHKKLFFIIFFASSICGVAATAFAYIRVSSFAHDTIYTNASTCPTHAIGIVFGCVKVLPNGKSNLYYLYRIRAAAELYKAGKVKHLLVSGDNHSVKYNEPKLMKRDLVQLGVPESDITCDFAGFSTFETIVRAKEIFGVDEATLITQRFHLPRALYIAAAHNLTAIGYEAKDPKGIRTLKTKIREIAARVVTFGDINIWGRNPKFIGTLTTQICDERRQ